MRISKRLFTIVLIASLLWVSRSVQAQPMSACEGELLAIEEQVRTTRLLDALTTATAALDLYTAEPTPCAATLYNWRALLYQTLNNLSAAEQDYQTALARWQVLLAPADERFELIDEGTDLRQATAATANNLGLLLARMGRYQDALQVLQESLALVEAAPPAAPPTATPQLRRRNSSRLARTPTSIAPTRPRRIAGTPTPAPLPEVPRPAPLLAPALQHQRFSILSNIGLVYLNLSEYDQADATFSTIIANATEPEQQAEALNHKALVARSQGRYGIAHTLLDQAEAAAPTGSRLLGIVWSNRGATYTAQKRYSEAIAAYQQALAFQGTVDSTEPTLIVFQFLTGLGATRRVVDDRMGRYETVPIVSNTADQAARALILHNIGNAYRLQGELDQAVSYFAQSLPLAEEAGSINGMIATLHATGLAHEAAGDQAQAIAAYQEAVSLLESLAARLTIPELQSAYNAKQAPIYANLVRLLAEKGHGDEAFAVAERARARAFLNQVGNHVVDLSGNLPPALAAQEQQLRQELAGLQQALNAAQAQSPRDEAAINALAAQLESARRTYTALLTQIKLRNPEFAALLNVETLDLNAVRHQLLDEQSTLVAYFVLEQTTLAWVVDRADATLVQLPVGEAELAGSTEYLRDSITQEQDFDRATAADLYAALIAPLKAHLHHANLILVPHNVLHYLPFAALWNETAARYLVEEYTVTYAPSASALQYIQANRNPNNGVLLALGNPDSTLPHATTEVQAVAARYRTTPFVGAQATERLVHTSQADSLHLAAHGVYDRFNPLFSHIALAPASENNPQNGNHSTSAYDGNLAVHEVFDLDLHQTNLVVLSACDTGQGKLSQGDELVGLTRAFLYAGTPNVVTSLWAVDDESTAYLMEHFYTHLQAGWGTAAALRQAQRETLAAYPAPYNWAAFTLHGDGR